MMNPKGMCSLHAIAWVLVIVGALNWGLVGVAKFDLVSALLHSWPTAMRIVYSLVGVSGLFMLTGGACCMKGGCKCGDGSCAHCNMEGNKMAVGTERKM